MGNLKHTKGEWKVLPNAPQFQIGIGTDKVTIAYTSVNVDKDFSNEAQANAKLIASAPDLLEALNSLVNKFGSVKQVQELGLEKELLNAINAINKATK